MFETPKISAFLQNASFRGENEKKYVRFQFYLTPISYELACEVSPRLADRLFRKIEDGAWAPASEVPSIGFDLGKIPLHTIELHPHDDAMMDHTGAMMQRAHITGIHARKLFPDNPNFTLIFSADVPMDDMSVKLAQKYFKLPVFLTFAVMQGQLFPDEDIEDTITNPICEECDDRAIFRDDAHAYYCQKHVRMTSNEVHSLVTKETPAQAEKRILKEREAKNQPALVMEGTVKEVVDDMSHANKPKGGRRKAAVN